MLTSFLPGQEEGNVDYVVEGGFGTFISDGDAHGIAETVADWLLDDEQGGKLERLSENAKGRGAPDAAKEIVEAIGESALRWKKINESVVEGFEEEVVEEMEVEDGFVNLGGVVDVVEVVEVGVGQGLEGP